MSNSRRETFFERTERQLAEKSEAARIDDPRAKAAAMGDECDCPYCRSDMAEILPCMKENDHD